MAEAYEALFATSEDMYGFLNLCNYVVAKDKPDHANQIFELWSPMDDHSNKEWRVYLEEWSKEDKEKLREFVHIPVVASLNDYAYLIVYDL